MSAGNAEKDQPSKTTAVNRIENQVFIDNSTYKELFKEAEFEKLCVYSKRPEKLDVLETSLQKIFGNDVELSTSDIVDCFCNQYLASCRCGEQKCQY